MVCVCERRFVVLYKNICINKPAVCSKIQIKYIAETLVFHKCHPSLLCDLVYDDVKEVYSLAPALDLPPQWLPVN